MTDAPPAVFNDRAGRPQLVFERVLAHPRERVWSALSTRAELDCWHPTPFELEPREGARVSFAAGDGIPVMPEGHVLACEPPHLLAYTWGEDELRWELAPHEHGCLLRLTHSFDDRFKAARDAAGWEICLRALAGLLGGTPPAAPGEQRLPGDWRELNGEYERRFGIAPEQATPPPLM
ncbi:MAG TPA: SRPBCC family protein [Solirubrobacteraceae bacterium]|jgi:uncharacterized protein YndB with AHSA1/START domain